MNVYVCRATVPSECLDWEGNDVIYYEKSEDYYIAPTRGKAQAMAALDFEVDFTQVRVQLVAKGVDAPEGTAFKCECGQWYSIDFSTDGWVFTPTCPQCGAKTGFSSSVPWEPLPCPDCGQLVPVTDDHCVCGWNAEFEPVEDIKF